MPYCGLFRKVNKDNPELDRVRAIEIGEPSGVPYEGSRLPGSKEGFLKQMREKFKRYSLFLWRDDDV